MADEMVPTVLNTNAADQASDSEPSDDALPFFDQWYWTMQGIRSIVDALGHDLRSGALAPLVEHFCERWRRQQDPVCPDLAVVDSTDSMLLVLRQLLNGSLYGKDELQAYTGFVDRLEEAAWLMPLWEEADVFVWLYRSLDEFSALLRFPTQESMVLWVHLAAMVKTLEKQWWLQGWADYIISSVYHRLDREHKFWICKPASKMGWIIPED